MTVTVRHWRFEDGKFRTENYGNRRTIPMDPIPRGWYCWVYADDQDNFIEWMGKHCPGSDCTFRFNSGDPMIQVYIAEDAEATLFTLRWMG